MVFGGNTCEKRQIWVSEPHFGEVRGNARPCVGKRMVNFLFPLIEFSRSLLRFRSYEAKYV